jgi:hypothetical protein
MRVDEAALPAAPWCPTRRSVEPDLGGRRTQDHCKLQKQRGQTPERHRVLPDGRRRGSDAETDVRASVLVRGIRAISDYEFELQMAMMNRRLSSKVETVFMMPAEAYSYLSSRLVKEVSFFGGSVRGLVPRQVEKRLAAKYKKSN